MASRKLEESSSVRNYSPTFYNLRDSTCSGSTTPPQPPVHFWKEMCRPVAQEELRNSISDWRYWRTEAEFFCQKVNGGEIERQNVSYSDYWRVEAQFWKNNCLASNPQATRHNLPNLGYWKCESFFWRSLCDPTDPLSASSIRYEIGDAEYWRAELYHYKDHPEPSTQSTMSDESAAQNAGVPSLSSAGHPTAYAPTTVTRSTALGLTPTLLYPQPAPSVLRRSKRLEAKTREAREPSKPAAGSAAVGRAKKNRVKKNRIKANRTKVNRAKDTKAAAFK
ncbi:MAG: hypothetical protein Q9217_006717 [Psora testacea]